MLLRAQFPSPSFVSQEKRIKLQAMIDEEETPKHETAEEAAVRDGAQWGTEQGTIWERVKLGDWQREIGWTEEAVFV